MRVGVGVRGGEGEVRVRVGVGVGVRVTWSSEKETLGDEARGLLRPHRRRCSSPP